MSKCDTFTSAAAVKLLSRQRTSLYSFLANHCYVQTSTCRKVCLSTALESKRRTPRKYERQPLTDQTAQVMKDEAGRPFIIVREYVTREKMVLGGRNRS